MKKYNLLCEDCGCAPDDTVSEYGDWVPAETAQALYDALEELERTVRKMGLDVSKARAALSNARGDV